MRGGWSIAELSRASGHSRWKIRSIVRAWLARPSPVFVDLASMKQIVVDGTYLPGRDPIFILMDGAKNEVVAGKRGVAEGSKTMRAYLSDLAARGLNPTSITMDGHVKVLACVRELWPRILVQRCLVHVQRQGLMWCRMKPKRTDAKCLRAIFLRVTGIVTKAGRDELIADIHAWEAKYGAKILRDGEKGWISSDMRRARSMLLKALPDMFRYLDVAGIPKTSNCIEGYIGRMKEIYRLHRGLATDRRNDYFRWHFHLTRR